MILGLDLSLTATGWATITHDGDLETGVLPDFKGHIAHRLAVWERELDQLATLFNPDRIYVEDLAGNQHGAFELGMIHATFWRAIWANGMVDRVTMVNAATLKTYATGKGNAPKALVLTEAVRRLGYDGYDHNEADAAWLADMGARLAGYPRPDLPATHLRALDKLKKAA